jgi:hypothetical protein
MVSLGAVNEVAVNEVINRGGKSVAIEFVVNTFGFFLTSTGLLRRFIITGFFSREHHFQRNDIYFRIMNQKDMSPLWN